MDVTRKTLFIHFCKMHQLDKIAYGDYSAFYVKLAQNVEIQILNELYATSHATGIVGYLEFDSRVVEDQKIAVMDLKAV